MKTIWNFIKHNVVAFLTAVAALVLEWWFHRSKPVPSVAQSKTDRSLGALEQKAKDEQQAAAGVSPAVWPTGDRAAVIAELKKDGVLK